MNALIGDVLALAEVEHLDLGAPSSYESESLICYSLASPQAQILQVRAFLCDVLNVNICHREATVDLQQLQAVSIMSADQLAQVALSCQVRSCSTEPTRKFEVTKFDSS